MITGIRECQALMSFRFLDKCLQRVVLYGGGAMVGNSDYSAVAVAVAVAVAAAAAVAAAVAAAAAAAVILEDEERGEMKRRRREAPVR